MITASHRYCNYFCFNFPMYFNQIPCKTSVETNYCLSQKLTLQFALVTVVPLTDSEPTLINQLTNTDGPPACTSLSLNPAQSDIHCNTVCENLGHQIKGVYLGLYCRENPFASHFRSITSLKRIHKLGEKTCIPFPWPTHNTQQSRDVGKFTFKSSAPLFGCIPVYVTGTVLFAKKTKIQPSHRGFNQMGFFFCFLSQDKQDYICIANYICIATQQLWSNEMAWLL